MTGLYIPWMSTCPPKIGTSEGFGESADEGGGRRGGGRQLTSGLDAAARNLSVATDQLSLFLEQNV